MFIHEFPYSDEFPVLLLRLRYLRSVRQTDEAAAAAQPVGDTWWESCDVDVRYILLEKKQRLRSQNGILLVELSDELNSEKWKLVWKWTDWLLNCVHAWRLHQYWILDQTRVVDMNTWWEGHVEICTEYNRCFGLTEQLSGWCLESFL